MQPLVGKSEAELVEVLVGLGAPAYRGRQLARALYGRFVREWDEIAELPRGLRESLSEAFALAPGQVKTFQSAPDGTTKYLVELPDSEVVEAVFLPYSGRNSICLSSQVGCPMACSFCATGTEGLARNLTAGEIVDQVLLLQGRHRESRISHVVYMGMGEPLLNLPGVLRSLELLHDEVGLSYRNLTVSTVGVVPQMARLAEADIPITLAVSLHAATDSLRSELVPLNEKYPIAVLMEACRSYVEKTKRRITFEYVLLAGVNDTDEQAHALGRLLQKQPLCALNTIPYNTTDVEARYRRPTPESTRRFRELVASYGVTVTQRAEKGHRIAAACGQLKRSALTPGRAMRPLPMAGRATR